jgi:hypothetical protein
MPIRGLLLAAALLASAITPAFATMRISEDRGGQIGHYMQTFAALRSSGERVVIDGDCLSACTLLLGIIPRSRMCATDRARLGFHAAWLPDEDGRPVTSTMGTRALWDAYPRSVRRWILRHGGLSRHMIYMEGRELRAFIPSCTKPERTYQARSRYAPRYSRYDNANAAGYRY